MEQPIERELLQNVPARGFAGAPPTPDIIRGCRWIRCSNIGEPGDGHKLYNGIDFMMLHNLAVLVFAA